MNRRYDEDTKIVSKDERLSYDPESKMERYEKTNEHDAWTTTEKKEYRLPMLPESLCGIVLSFLDVSDRIHSVPLVCRYMNIINANHTTWSRDVTLKIYGCHACDRVSRFCKFIRSLHCTNCTFTSHVVDMPHLDTIVFERCRFLVCDTNTHLSASHLRFVSCSFPTEQPAVSLLSGPSVKVLSFHTYAFDNSLQSTVISSPSHYLVLENCTNIDEVHFQCLKPTLIGLSLAASAPVSDLCVQYTSHCENLHCLNLSQTNVRDLTDIHKLEHLETLVCSLCTKLQDSALTNVARCRRLRCLDITGCIGLTDHGIAALSDLSCLRTLYMSCLADLTGATLDRLPNLHELQVSNAQLLSSNGKDAISHMTDLRWLNLQNVSIDTIRQCRYLPSLAVLLVGLLNDDDMDDATLGISKVESIRVLVLRRWNFTRAIMSCLSSMPNLCEVWAPNVQHLDRDVEYMKNHGSFVVDHMQDLTISISCERRSCFVCRPFLRQQSTPVSRDIHHDHVLREKTSSWI